MNLRVELHATALAQISGLPSEAFDATAWDRIVARYDELLTIQDTPVIRLNRAVAVAEAYDIALALCANEPERADLAKRRQKLP